MKLLYYKKKKKEERKAWLGRAQFVSRCKPAFSDFRKAPEMPPGSLLTRTGLLLRWGWILLRAHVAGHSLGELGLLVND